MSSYVCLKVVGQTTIGIATGGEDPLYTEANPNLYETETIANTSEDHTYKSMNLDNNDESTTPKEILNPYETELAQRGMDTHVYNV